MYEPVLLYARAFHECPSTPGEGEADLAYVYAFAEYMIFLGAEEGAYSPWRFKLIAERAPEGSAARFSACLKLLVHTARFDKDQGEAIRWSRKAKQALKALALPCGSLKQFMWESRLHRATAFVPFLEGRYAASLSELELALDLGWKVPVRSARERIVRNENIYPVLESTAKACLACNDLSRAFALTKQMVALDPWDGLARLELGNILYRLDRFEDAAEQYEWAVTLGPPGTEIAAFLAGEAYKAAGQSHEAVNMYLRSLEADPEGVSPRERLSQLAASPKYLFCSPLLDN
jgi:tetratricopeptide (TPR) repeat protein